MANALRRLATASSRVALSRVAAGAPRAFVSDASATATPCWSCDARTTALNDDASANFFCDACGAIQPPVAADYFALLGVCVCDVTARVLPRTDARARDGQGTKVRARVGGARGRDEASTETVASG
jgi:hypothetical protein